jgi:hypothetical protein
VHEDDEQIHDDKGVTGLSEPVGVPPQPLLEYTVE